MKINIFFVFRLMYIYWIESRMFVFYGIKVFVICCMFFFKVILGCKFNKVLSFYLVKRKFGIKFKGELNINIVLFFSSLFIVF